ncbi:MAG TPA: peptidylprolyl isomerase [Acidobacteriaceae bacterium]|nr:peptidylprolyl isomerase [Acidobacteriaceae bacterium]
MRISPRIAFVLLFSLALVEAGLAQQANPPASTPQAASPASSQTPSPASSQDLPDSPGTQAPVSPQPTGPTAVFDTSMGRITCKLFSKEAPETVANFIGLAEGTKDWTDPTTKQKVHGKPLYNGTTFHRVIPEFMIQGGDPTGTGMGDPGYYFKDEFYPGLNFDVPGRLAMANSGPDTNGSQFFITEVPTEYLNQKHTIFGQCDDSSVLVVKSIARVERDSNDKPIEPVILEKVTIVRDGQPMPPPPTSASSASPGAAAPAKPQ